MSTSLSIYKMEDEMLLGLLDAYESTQPDTLERTAADAAIARHLTSLSVRDRVDRVCSVIGGLEGQVQAADTQMMRLRQCKERMENAIAKIKDQVATQMASLGVKRISGSVEALALHDNPVAVDFTDEDLVPPEFKTVKVTMSLEHWHELEGLIADTGNDHLFDLLSPDTPVIRKSLIKPILKRGDGVPGAFLSQSVTLQRK